ncbi:MAG: hypothetical protein IJ179_07955 [Oscillospiraceae bacterium]|nr:hypothetical protein [Oscillospiraceae bacterium]
MKKLLLISLLCLALLLCACEKAAPPAPAQTATEPAAAEEAPASADTAPAQAVVVEDTSEESDQQAALGELLSWMRDYVTIGTAGSSLRAAAAAAELLDWADGCTLDAAGVAAAYEAWAPGMNPDIPVDFAEQLGAVDYNVRMLTGEDTEQAAMLLADAGCEDCGYPWDAHALSVTEALMQAAGLR